MSAPSAGSSVATAEDIVDTLAQEVDMAEEAATQRFLSALSTGSTPLAVAKTVLTDKDTLHTAEKLLNENIAQNGQSPESAKVGGGYLHRLSFTVSPAGVAAWLL